MKSPLFYLAWCWLLSSPLVELSATPSLGLKSHTCPQNKHRKGLSTSPQLTAPIYHVLKCHGITATH